MKDILDTKYQTKSKLCILILDRERALMHA